MTAPTTGTIVVVHEGEVSQIQKAMTASTTRTIAVDGSSAPDCDMVPAGRLDTVLVKTASRCNIDCSYCYVYQGPDTTWRLQPKRMHREVATALRDRLVEQAGRQEAGFAIVLHGGEPLLLGFDELATLLRGLRARLSPDRYPISIQTNGTLLSEKSLDLFAATRTSVSVSIDGPPEANDLARLNHRGESTYAATMRGIRLLASHSDSAFLFAGTLSVLQPAVDPRLVYEFLKTLGTPSMNFLLQDGNHDHLPSGKARFNSTEYGQWLISLLDLYLADPSPVPIRVVDDIIKLCLGGMSQKEGQGENRYGILIIETNGEIRKNDTLRASFEGADQFGSRWNITTTSLSRVLSSQEYLAYTGMQVPESSRCRNCNLLAICGGGMPLYRWSADRGYDNPSVYCHDHAVFIRHAITRLHELGLRDSLVVPPFPVDVS